MHNFSRKLKILMVHPHDVLEKSEPWTTRIVNIAGRMCDRGHEVKLIYFSYGENRLNEVNHFKKNFQLISFNRKCGTLNFIRNLMKMCKMVEWADVVHFQKCFHYASIPVVFSCFLKNKPVHYDWDDWETQIYHYGEPASRLVGIFMYLLERILPKVVDSISVSSEKIKELSYHYGMPQDRITEAPVGADLNNFKPENSRSKIKEKFGIDLPIVLYLGQLHGAQYAEIFVETARIICETKPEVKAKFMVVGGGSRLDELQRLASSWNLDNHLIFTDFVLPNEVPAYIAAASVCVASFVENSITVCKSPLKIVEYLASGKPIVASNVGEVRKMVGGAGLLVKAGDSVALAEGIVKILNSPELAKKMSRLARKRAIKKYNWESTTENILNMYQKIT